jgi:hypothetical protein
VNAKAIRMAASVRKRLCVFIDNSFLGVKI